MKKGIITIILAAVMLAGCGKDPATIPKNEPGFLRQEKDGDKYYRFTDGELGGDITVEEGSFKIKQIAFAEEKKGAYYEAYAVVILDMTNMSEDARHWFDDSFGGEFDDYAIYMRVEADDRKQIMHRLTDDIVDLDGVPSYSVIYALSDIKHSVNGNNYYLTMDLKQPENHENHYEFSGTINTEEETAS